jgi:hypothetical protein
MVESVKLKYLCSSFSTPITQDEIHEKGPYPVFGASGLVGYKEEYACDVPYLGIIKDGAGVGRITLKTAVQATHVRAGAHAHGGKTFSPPSLNG